MKKIINTITFKIIITIILTSIIILGVDLSFWLMNQANTIAFVIGVIVLITTILTPLEIIIRYKNKSK